MSTLEQPPISLSTRLSIRLCFQANYQLKLFTSKSFKALVTPSGFRTQITPGSLIYTDEYRIYARLEAWGYQHKSVCHAQGEYARDEDGDGFCEVHVNTMEGFWSLLRSWLRPHRGISQAKLPLYLGFFQFVHNARKRGKALLSALLECLLCQISLESILSVSQLLD